jgi:hypothetical protein
MSSARWISAWSASGSTRGDRLSSCPGLTRASTFFLAMWTKDVDGRVKPGHDGEINYLSRNLPEAMRGRPVTGQL